MVYGFVSVSFFTLVLFSFLLYSWRILFRVEILDELFSFSIFALFWFSIRIVHSPWGLLLIVYSSYLRVRFFVKYLPSFSTYNSVWVCSTGQIPRPRLIHSTLSFWLLALPLFPRMLGNGSKAMLLVFDVFRCCEFSALFLFYFLSLSLLSTPFSLLFYPPFLLFSLSFAFLLSMGWCPTTIFLFFLFVLFPLQARKKTW